MEVLDHKCPGCGAKLPFNPENQKWDCGYCGGTYTLEQLTEFEEKQKKAKVDTKVDADMYECPNCGAKIIADENTSATFCVYCGSTSIIKSKLVDEFKPDKIIPFKNTKKDAVEAFKKFRKGKLFAPKDFDNPNNIEKITGVYIPFWAYDCNSEGTIEGKAENTKSWRSGDYRYTQVDEYFFRRKGKMEFERVPTDGSTKFDDDTMDSIEPFNYNDLLDFNMSYLSGFLAEKYDVGEEEAYTRASERMNNSTVDRLRSTVTGYGSVIVQNRDINLTKKKAEYFLLPVWMLNIKYNDQMYLFAMNGQTGKMVGNIPIDKKKRWLYRIGFFTIAFVISCVAMYLIQTFG